MADPITGDNNVSKQSVAVAGMAEAWTLIAALMGGTFAMRKHGKKYLPQWPAEESNAYNARLATATLFPAYARTVSVLTGKPFSKPITIGEDVPTRIRDFLENVDLEGRNLHAFTADLCHDALGYGLCGILVDCPPADGVRTVEEERKAGIRPYFVHIRPEAVLGWKTVKRGGETAFAQLRLLEIVEEDDGQFGTNQIAQVRVLEPGKWETYRKANAEGGIEKWVLYQQGTTSIDVIPFVPVYGKRRDFMIGAPPMIELAHMNVEHWQSKSDQQTILHVARVPMLFGKDLGTDTSIVVGAGSFINATSKDADIKYVEHSGKAIEAGRMSLLDLEDRMRQVGAELLVIKPGNTTEVQTLADNEQGMCDLQRIMQSLEDALDQALDLMAKFIKEPKGGHVTIFSDFGAATLAEASAQLLFEMTADGSLTHETLLNELKRRGILSPDIDVKKEVTDAKAENAEREPQRKENVNI
ncbi:MAG: DUF4055 domain-containing protein [Acidobacteriaceae bacterium]